MTKLKFTQKIHYNIDTKVKNIPQNYTIISTKIKKAKQTYYNKSICLISKWWLGS